MKSNNLGIIQKTIVGAQFLFVAFGATVLVPLLVGLDPSVALLTAGIGTLIFHAITKGKVPVFLGIGHAEFSISSFTIGGIGLAALVGVLLNLVIPKSKPKQ